MKRTMCILLAIAMIVPVFMIANADDIVVPSFTKFKDNPILSARKAKPGEAVNFDSAAITDPCVVYANGKYHMWYTGWVNWLAGSGRQGRIGYAISVDGKSWNRIAGSEGGIEAPGAVLGIGSSTDFDGLSVSAPWVIYDEGKFKMYYVGTDTKGRQTIGFADSMNGIYWNKKSQVMRPTNESAFDSFNIGKCSVVKVDKTYKMWYEGQSKLDSRWRIGYANSYDGVSWTKNVGEKTGGCVLDLGEKVTDFDNFAVRGPGVVFDGAYYYMWYDTSMRDEKTSQIGLATSINGLTWQKRGVSLDYGRPGEFDNQRVVSPSVVKIGLVFNLYYCNYTDTNSGFGLATSGDLPVNIGSGVVKVDCKAGDGFDLSLGNKTKDPTMADLIFDCGFGTPRMCGRWIRNTVDFDNAECIPAEGYPSISNVREKCDGIEVGATYAIKTIAEQNYAKIKIEGIWQDPTDPTHFEITFKWMYQSNGSPCFIGNSKDPPSKPYNLSCVAGDRTIKLVWTPSFIAPGKVISYYVYRADNPGDAAKSMTPIHDFPVTTPQYTDKGLVNNKSYCYVVRAIDQFGNKSEASNETCCMPRPIHPPPFPPPTGTIPGQPVIGDGSYENPYVVEKNPWEFDWCGFQPQTLIIINGVQYIADGNGCIHVSIQLQPGKKNQIEYVIITPTGDSVTGTIWALLKDTNIHLELTIGQKILYKNGNPIILDTAATIVNNRTFVPFRAIGEAMDCKVEWDDKQRKVTVSNCLNKIELWIGKPTALVNGQPIPIASDNNKVVPVIVNGRTMVPFRFIAETFGANVQWDAAQRKVTIDYTPPNCPKTP